MSNKLSSSSIFHFTRKERFESILENLQFLPNYCQEDIVGTLCNNPNKQKHYIPMVCFCDIPLTKTNEHCDAYGFYGIGLYREKIAKNNPYVNPIIYKYGQTNTLDTIRNLLKGFNEIINSEEEKDYVQKTEKVRQLADIDKQISNLKMLGDISKVLNALQQERENLSNELKPFKLKIQKKKNAIKSLYPLLQLIKPYEGRVYKKDESFYKIFYDEKEWRFVPPLEYWGMVDSKYMNDTIRKYLEIESKRNPINRLEFDLEDISFIIVEDKDYIPEFIKKLEVWYKESWMNKKPSINEKQLKQLFVKVLTVEQIRQDF